MNINRDKPDLWLADISESVEMFNNWFLRYAPRVHRVTREKTTEDVQRTFELTEDLTDLDATQLRASPQIIRTLRMSTQPTLAVDRLIGLANVPKNLVKNMENGTLPTRISTRELNRYFQDILRIVKRLLDKDILVWLYDKRKPTRQERTIASMVIADRLCGADANPIVRNAHEQRQLRKLTSWLRARSYRAAPQAMAHDSLEPGTFAIRRNVSVEREDGSQTVNIPIDLMVMPRNSRRNQLPLLIEAKSAGDYTNVNKRRKEEATKVNLLRRKYGVDLRFTLFLCGYFDAGYLGFEAAEGIDWIWEHRVDDLARLGL